jgi:hypothetical protein
MRVCVQVHERLAHYPFSPKYGLLRYPAEILFRDEEAQFS